MENGMTIVFVVHGVQVKLAGNYADDFIKGIKTFLPDKIIKKTIFCTFDWSSLVEERQKYLLNTILFGMGKRKIREIGANVIADVLWYLRTKKSDSQDTYHSIHEKLTREINTVHNTYGENSKIVLIGHSLGSQIVLDSVFENLKIFKINGLITMGSPIAYISGAFLDGGYPPPLDFFVNFWNTNDVISTILGQINDDWKLDVEDIRVQSWNPLNWLALTAHTFYWKSEYVWKKIASILSEYH